MSAVPIGPHAAYGAAPVTRSAPAWGPLYAILLGYPLWWALGGGYFLWPLLTLPLLLALLARGELRIPPGFGIWLLFLGWMLLSGTQLTGMSFAFVWRASIYLSATILFLYVFNADRRRISDRAIVTLLALFWLEVIVAGLVGVLLPTLSFQTPFQKLIPGSFLHDDLIRATVHPALADVMTILGYPVGRPKALFAYTNQWGACAAVLTPFAFAAFSQARRRVHRRALVVLMLLSLVPIVVSLNRGVWLALGAALAYTAVRFLRPGNARALAVGATLLASGAMLLYVTPLGTLVHDRVSTESASTHTRLTLYAGTRDQVARSPYFGVGSPSTRTQEGSAPPVGTQGQIALLAYSHGIPALIFFVGWFGHAALRSARRGSPIRFSAHLAILIAILLMPYYSLLPVTLHVLMVAAALSWRDVLWPRAEPA